MTSMLDEAHTVMKVLARGASADDIKRFMDFSSGYLSAVPFFIFMSCNPFVTPM